MSQCERYQEWISRMVDGDLSQAEEQELREHVQSCPECALLYQAFSALSDEMQSDLENVPLDLRESVMAEVRREEIRRRNRIPSILRGVMSVAACLAVIVGVYLGVSLTKGDGRLRSAVSRSSGSAQETKAMAMPEEAPAVIASLLPQPEAQAEVRAETPAVQENAMGTQRMDSAPTADDAQAMPEVPAESAPEPAPEPAAEAEEEMPTEEAASEPEPAGEEWELQNWDLDLLRALLKGSPAELNEDALQGHALGRIRVQNRAESYTVELYELNGALYYRDPAEETIYRAELTVEELRAFFEA